MRRLVVGSIIATMCTISAVIAQPAHAIDLFPGCTDANCSIVKEDRLDYLSGASGVWKAIQLATGALGLVAVIMIVIGGIKYTTSGGDAGGTKSAKDTILYAAIGLVVALIGQAVVLLVTRFFG
jgi:hypothetical protein